MTKCDVDFRNVISTKEHGCLKHLKMQLAEQHSTWELVMVNIKYVIRSVLKALDYMHSQGLVHRDVKGMYKDAACKNLLHINKFTLQLVIFC